jgi:hypothetical protein
VLSCFLPARSRPPFCGAIRFGHQELLQNDEASTGYVTSEQKHAARYDQRETVNYVTITAMRRIA